MAIANSETKIAHGFEAMPKDDAHFDQVVAWMRWNLELAKALECDLGILVGNVLIERHANEKLRDEGIIK